MRYPNFAFYAFMRWVVFFWNCFVTTLSYYWGAALLLRIYQKKISFRRQLAFSFLSAILLNILVIYGYSYLHANLTGIYTTSLDSHKIMASLGNAYRFFIIVMNPFCYVILYHFGVRILQLPPFRSVKMMHLTYVYFVCCSILIKGATKFFIPKTVDLRGYNGLQDLLLLTQGTIVIYIFYKINMKLIEVFNFILDLPMNTIVIDIRKSLFWHFLLSSFIYFLVALLMSDLSTSGTHYFLLALLLFMYMLLSIMWDYYDMQKSNLQNREGYLAVLRQSVAQFRGVKHDFNNILQTYSGYLSVKDYEKLESYHSSVVDTIHQAEVSLDLNQRILENPSFFLLLDKKRELAQQKGVVFQIDLQCKMDTIPMDELDFAKVCGVFLDNAIQYATQTLSKTVHIFAYQKKEGDYLFIFSNNPDSDLSITINPTKEGISSFIGAYNILSRYGNTTMNIVQQGETISIYFKII